MGARNMFADPVYRPIRSIAGLFAAGLTHVRREKDFDICLARIHPKENFDVGTASIVNEEPLRRPLHLACVAGSLDLTIRAAGLLNDINAVGERG